jgi:divalent metal cation (Fe/Co/Zn/Cd) transporter
VSREQFETLGTLGISGALLVAGAGLAHQAYTSIVDIAGSWSGPSDAAAAMDAALHGHGHLAVGVAVASIAVKEVLFRWTHSVGVRLKSQVTWWC